MTARGASDPGPRPAAAPRPAGVPTGDLPGWHQTYREDFARGAPLGGVAAVYGADMAGYSGLSDTSGRGTYLPSRVLSVTNGSLDWYIHSEAGRHLVAAPIPMGYAGQTYGRYSVRFRSDPLPGYKIAFLLWPTSDRWDEGEIDWPEGDLNGRMSPASAVRGSFANGAMTFDPPVRSWSATNSAGWHVATTEWTPGKVRWFWDDSLVTETTISSGVPTTPMRWTLQAETAIGGPAPAGSVSGHLAVDWVTAYSYAPGTH